MSAPKEVEVKVIFDAPGNDDQKKVVETSEEKTQTYKIPATSDLKKEQEGENLPEPEGSALEVVRNFPDGNYKIVTLALDLTGKKVTDEIFQLAACASPKNRFSQYVMPYQNISLGSTREHGVRVFVNFRTWRVLRNVRSMRALKSKSIYLTLLEFLDWLKEMKGDSDGIVLLCHDHKFHNIPFFLKKAVGEYKLNEQFDALVKGFVNSPKLIREGEELEMEVIHVVGDDGTKKQKRLPSVSLRALLRKAYDEYKDEKERDKLDIKLQSAKNRADLSYQLNSKLFNCEEGELTLAKLKTAIQKK